MLAAILEQDAKYPVIGKQFDYGTSGFRTLATTLDRVCFRVGILVALRAKKTSLSGV